MVRGKDDLLYEKYLDQFNELCSISFDGKATETRKIREFSSKSGVIAKSKQLPELISQKRVEGDLTLTLLHPLRNLVNWIVNTAQQYSKFL